MEPKHTQIQARQPRLEPNAAISLVECTVRVSPTLARLMRKCAATEAGGASAHDALLALAGVQPGEIGALRDQANQYAEDFRHAQERAVQVQRALDQAKGVIAQRDKELSELRRKLKSAADAENQSQMTIAAQKVDLIRSIPTVELDERAEAAIRTFGARLCRGENIKVAALGTAGYSLLDVEAAMAKQDRDEMRAFEALLERPTWRRGVVLWLLGPPAEQ